MTEALEAGEDEGILRRREKRQLAGACFFGALLLSTYAGALILASRTSHEAIRMKTAGVPALEVQRLEVKTMAIMDLCAFGMFIGFLGLIVCFVNWQSAIRRRRREEAGQKP